MERLLHFRSVQFVQEFVVNAGFPLVTLQACNRCAVVIEIAGRGKYSALSHRSTGACQASLRHGKEMSLKSCCILYQGLSHILTESCSAILAPDDLK